MLGGVCPVPRAWRNSDMTMMTRTNEVIIKSSEGNSVSAVISASNWSVRGGSPSDVASTIDGAGDESPRVGDKRPFEGEATE